MALWLGGGGVLSVLSATRTRAVVLQCCGARRGPEIGALRRSFPGHPLHIEVQVTSRKEGSDAVEGSRSAGKVLVVWGPEPRRGEVK